MVKSDKIKIDWGQEGEGLRGLDTKQEMGNCLKKKRKLIK
jgi:hypothetical protein